MPRPSISLEKKLWEKGYSNICGIDEVGRGSWAGPLVAAAVILPKNFRIPKVFGDSKQLKPKLREETSIYIQNCAISYSISEIPVNVINKIGVGAATHMAFRAVIKNLKTKVDFALIDAFYIKHFSKKKQLAIVKGDEKCASIAAASIIAKVYRDKLMQKMDITYPSYGFFSHKGYGTKLHQEAIKKLGFSKIHRTNYKLNFLFA